MPQLRPEAPRPLLSHTRDLSITRSEFIGYAEPYQAISTPESPVSALPGPHNGAHICMVHMGPWQQLGSPGHAAAACTLSHGGVRHPATAAQFSPDQWTAAHQQRHVHLIEGSPD